MERVIPVFIDSQCLRSLVTSALEVYNRETNGALIGKLSVRKIRGKRRRVMSIKDIYVYQTDIRKPSEVYHGNISAYKRVLNSLRSMKMNIVGGYHSHAFPYNCSRLSADDILFAEEEMEAINKSRYHANLSRWLEILLSLRKWESKKKHRTGWEIKKLSKKLRVIVATSERIKYDVFVSAYWITFMDGKPRVREARVFTPWVV
ncbi:MAG TPA: hypothetical protein ENG00_00035 [Candidatus Aenigmarchaeota archaeon]|nr:hypothetical protein [Candidatus Aenigmarchaeota archaeon]